MNSMNEANKYFNQIPPILQEAYQPYMGWSNPSQMQNQWQQDFNQSPFQQMQMQNAERAARASAAAGGQVGGSNDMSAYMSNGVFGDQMQNYINNNMQGMGMGLQAAQGYSGDMSNLLGTQGDLAYQNSENENQKNSDWLNMLIQGGAGAATGFAMGGIPGALVGGIGGAAGAYGKKGGNPNLDMYMRNRNQGGFAQNRQPGGMGSWADNWGGSNGQPPFSSTF